MNSTSSGFVRPPECGSVPPAPATLPVPSPPVSLAPPSPAAPPVVAPPPPLTFPPPEEMSDDEVRESDEEVPQPCNPPTEARTHETAPALRTSFIRATRIRLVILSTCAAKERCRDSQPSVCRFPARRRSSRYHDPASGTTSGLGIPQ